MIFKLKMNIKNNKISNYFYIFLNIHSKEKISKRKIELKRITLFVNLCKTILKKGGSIFS